MTKLMLFIVAVMMLPVMFMAADNGKAPKRRAIVLTEIEDGLGEAMSMVRFLTCPGHAMMIRTSEKQLLFTCLFLGFIYFLYVIRLTVKFLA